MPQRPQPEPLAVERPGEVVERDSGIEQRHADRGDDLVPRVKAAIGQRLDRADLHEPLDELGRRARFREERAGTECAHARLRLDGLADHGSGGRDRSQRIDVESLLATPNVDRAPLEAARIQAPQLAHGERDEELPGRGQ